MTKKPTKKKRTAKEWLVWLWRDDSWQAWLASVLVAFILIKYVLYPGIGLLFGTPLPVVAVVSGSMQHNAQDGVICGVRVDAETDWWSACGQWYDERGISQEAFNEFKFPNGFNKGDIMVVRGVSPQAVDVGDVIIYHANKQYPLIHRVVTINDTNGLRYTTKGDNNPQPIVEYALSDGRYLYACYQEQGGRAVPAPCAVGVPVTSQTPGAVAVLDETNIHPDQLVGRAIGRIPFLGYVKILFVDFLDALGLTRVAQLF